MMHLIPFTKAHSNSSSFFQHSLADKIDIDVYYAIIKLQDDSKIILIEIVTNLSLFLVQSVDDN